MSFMENGFQGKKDQLVPKMTTDVVDAISNRYIELYEIITGKDFQKPKKELSITNRIKQNILSSLELN